MVDAQPETRNPQPATRNPQPAHPQRALRAIMGLDLTGVCDDRRLVLYTNPMSADGSRGGCWRKLVSLSRTELLDYERR